MLLFENRLEKEKMLAGELYNASDPLLKQERQRARSLIHQLNVTHYSDQLAYKQILMELLPNASDDIWIEPPFFCDYGYNIFIGEKVFFNFNCVLLDVMPIRIGSNVLFGPNVQIYTAAHPIDAMERRKGFEFAKPISIGNDCWIGGSVIITPGVTIGDRCILGAGTVVTKDVQSDTIVVGNPAKTMVMTTPD
ncbi:MAG: sugar O-acetyltransferase [Desulfobacterales bacterium]|nr:sugar O-acetyltransferase [Desulfobacterales bacterium]MBF0395953.1 sugar O-acetyltransferase [Desulfobacterales bacterium]